MESLQKERTLEFTPRGHRGAKCGKAGTAGTGDNMGTTRRFSRLSELKNMALAPSTK
jgi:hypothetical protein